jgi:putative tricarboxylic transport membrane protein
MVMLVFAIVGYVMRIFEYSVVAFIIGFVLTPQLESAIIQSLIITNAEPSAILEHPIAIALLVLSAISIVYLGPKRGKAVAGD